MTGKLHSAPARRAGRDSVARLLTRLRQPGILLGLALAVLLAVLVALPLARLLGITLSAEGRVAWGEVLTSALAPNLFWRPLANTLLIGLAVAAVTTLLGGFLAWLVMLTDVPGRGLLGLLGSLPFALPSFAVAMAWETLFRNDRLGGQIGFLAAAGLPVPNWLAWGFVPIVLSLSAHYFSLTFLLISAALASVNSELLEAAEMTGATRARVLRDITLPVVAPAILSAALLAFAEAISNFAVPAVLGLPVRFYTLSTRLYGAIRTGQEDRGYVLTVLVILLAAAVLLASTRLTRRRSFTTITGKGGRVQPQRLAALRWPLFALAIGVCVATMVVPTLALLLSSLTRRTGSLAGGLTAHFWVGASDAAFAQGQRGVLRNPEVVGAALNTALLGLAVAASTAVLGLLIGYVVARGRAGWLGSAVGLLSFLPFLVPGIAFGAMYIAQFGRPFGPIPALYGTLALLILAGAAQSMPFAAQAGRTAMGQVSGELEEAAVMTGAGLWRRLADIFAPLTLRGLIAGAVLAFTKMARDLSLTVLLVTPTTTLLSVVAFRYASEGFAQLASAITLVIALLSVGATLLARRLQGAAQPWNER
ncbi:MAG: iron ABC transporter permease [Chloroflexales bacterium]|nr:iron ABC transporter permease [Chloroflexales bacterium]